MSLLPLSNLILAVLANQHWVHWILHTDLVHCMVLLTSHYYVYEINPAILLRIPKIVTMRTTKRQPVIIYISHTKKTIIVIKFTTTAGWILNLNTYSCIWNFLASRCSWSANKGTPTTKHFSSPRMQLIKGAIDVALHHLKFLRKTKKSVPVSPIYFISSTHLKKPLVSSIS